MTDKGESMEDEDLSLLDLASSIDEILNLDPESEEGNIEYKRQLLNLTEKRTNRLTTQMLYRLEEGNGECYYQLGINDNGTPFGLTEEEFVESLTNLKMVASNANAKINTIEEKIVKKDKKIARVLIRKESSEKIDIKVAILGNVDSGKSSLIGVLHSGQADDGRGSARKYLLIHPHEKESGQTSDESNNITGFTAEGKHVSSSDEIKNLSWKDIVNASSKIISITDLCGHEKFFHTTIRGMIGTDHDYAILLVESTRGVQHMTKQHVTLCNYFKLPFFILLTKVDLCKDKPQILAKTMEQINDLATTGTTKQTIHHIKSKNDLLTVVENFKATTDGRYPILPVISISNTEMTNIDLLLSFLNLLPIRVKFDHLSDPLFSVKKVYKTKSGTVVYGFLVKGIYKKGDKMLIGPDADGKYMSAKIRDIEWHRSKVQEIKAGSSYTLNIIGKDLKRKWIKRGMVIISEKAEKIAVNEFDAQIYITKNVRSTITIGSSSIIYINNIRQSATILSIVELIRRNGKREDINEIDFKDKKNAIRGGDRATIRLRFNKSTYLQEKGKFVIRENNLNGIGMIKKVYN